MILEERIKAFAKLGIFLEQFSTPGNTREPMMPWLEELNKQFYRPLDLVIQNSHIQNPWFTEDNLRHALGHAGRSLNMGDIAAWLNRYRITEPGETARTVAVIMAGNIPLAGFHDMLCVLISGHHLLAKLSLKDDQLMKLFAEILCFINNDFQGKIGFEEGRLKDFDAVIATGSDNTARYFEYYFGKYPHIIRKNRNSASILDGSETKEELQALSDDVFRYFGLGCRSVSKLLVPENYDFTILIEAFSGYRHLINHNQWANNYDYQKAIHLIDHKPHLDSGFFLIREDESYNSPIAVLNNETVKNSGHALDITGKNKDILQCVTGKPSLSANIVPFGRAQEPGLADFADNIDTMEFLVNL